MRLWTSIQGGRIKKPMRVWELPVTNLVINAVESMAENQGIKSLKMSNRNKSNFYPADWIAGVEYEHQNNDDNGDDRDYEDETSMTMTNWMMMTMTESISKSSMIS